MKRFWVSYSTTILLCAIFIGIVVWLYLPISQGITSFVSSPLPPSLTRIHNKEVTTLNLWLPTVLGSSDHVLRAPAIGAKAALVYDMESRQTFYEKNSREKLPMASLTKITTAIVALENKKQNDSYIVSKSDLVGENSMSLTEGEILSQEELLYGLVLNSANDAAEVLAHNFLGGRKEFITAMNNKALALGLSDTHFTNPSGLQGDGTQQTSAYDLLVITKYALTNFPLFTKIVSTHTYSIPQTITHKAYYLENETNLLTSYPGVKGVKDGYTPEAGLCLVTYLEYKGHNIIGVILGSGDRRGEMIELLDYSLQRLGTKPPFHD